MVEVTVDSIRGKPNISTQGGCAKGGWVKPLLANLDRAI